MIHFSTQFIWICCQIGAEKALKEELTEAHPELRFAFSRPGFVTFKFAMGPRVPEDFRLRSVFARCWGFSVGPQASIEKAAEAARVLAAQLEQSRLGLEVWERSLEQPQSALPWRTDLEQRLGSLIAPSTDDKPEWILDFCGGADEKPEYWLGCHRRGSRPAAMGPGGQIEVTMPEDSPSRAFIKLEQALAWSGAQPQAGQCALEVGSAPGGASYALLLRGLEVIGVDPADMSPMLLERFSKQFIHVRKTVSELQGSDLVRPIEWLVLDINAKPKVSLTLTHEMLARSPQRFAALKGMILTLKINEWKLARFVPEWLEKVREMSQPFGLTQVSGIQLPANRQEICVVARKRIAR